VLGSYCTDDMGTGTNLVYRYILKIIGGPTAALREERSVKNSAIVTGGISIVSFVYLESL